jgi:hypothetical protein
MSRRAAPVDSIGSVTDGSVGTLEASASVDGVFVCGVRLWFELEG